MPYSYYDGYWDSYGYPSSYGSYYGGYGGKNYYDGYYDYYSSYYSSRKSIEPSKLENINQDSFDRLMFQDVKVINPKVGETLRTGKFYLHSFEELARDLFCSLYKNDPMLKKEPPEGTLFNRKILEEFMSNPQTELLRDYTVYDDFYAGCASVNTLNDIIERIKTDEDLKKIADKQNQILGMEDGEGKEEEIENLKKLISTQSEKINEVVSKAIIDAQKDVKKKDDIMDFFGCSKEIENSKLKPQDKFNLLEEYERIKDMAKYIGRYRQLASSSRFSNKKDKNVELCSIDLGDDIMHALPTEQLLMMNPTLKMEFFRKYTEKQLIQYNFKRDVPSGQGPIIALLDDSGSMYDGNDTAKKARGALFGLIEVAKKEKRDIGICIFSSGGEMSTFLIEKGKVDPQQIVQILEIMYAGGTNYYEPLEWALDLAKKSLFKEADIVMITDGDCYLNNSQLSRINKLKRERDLKSSVILLGDYDFNDNLEEWADNIYTDSGDDTFKSIYDSM